MTDPIDLRSGDVLLVIDAQNDFCDDGALPVAGGHAIMPLIDRIAARFEHVVFTQDWHPAGHASFADTHGVEPFSTVRLAYGDQTAWPSHCVAGTAGAAIHPGLAQALDRAELIIRKGHHRDIDSYSAFYENDRATPTGLAGYLRERGFRRVFLVGLAYDFCVRFSAEDAVREGFEAVVIEDATRAIDLDGSKAGADALFRGLGVRVIRSTALA